MTSHQQPDVDGRGKRAGAAAAQQQASDFLAKSYRYLRLAMVGLLLCLAVAVIIQSLSQGDILGSVSAYYYTPAQAFFVGGLIGLGACMIALKGTTTVQDIALNLGGVFAAIVAIVPTGRPADEQTAVDACKDAGTPLLTEKASTGPTCPTPQGLEDATTANVDNNLWALLVVGVLALGAALYVAWKDGTLKPEGNGEAKRRFWRGFGWALGLGLAVLFARLVLSLQWVINNGHWIAAVFLFVCIFVVGAVNALQVQREKSGDFSPEAPSTREAVGQTVGDLIAVFGENQRNDRYIWIARLMLVVGLGSVLLWRFTDRITLFWVEALVFLLFMAFWTAQTFELERELERSTKAAGAPPPLPLTSASTDVQDRANS